MTLAVAAWCSNGIAICADSRSSFLDQSTNTTRIASDATEKLFKLGRVGVATAGVNILNERTIHIHMCEILDRFTDQGPEEVAHALADYFYDQYQEQLKKSPQTRSPKNDMVVRFLVVGFAGDEAQAYLANVVEQAAGDKIQATGEYEPIVVENGRGVFRVGKSGLTWIGDSDIADCLVLGYNRSVLGNIPPLNIVNRVIPIGLFGLQDCIDLICFLVQATERMKHFSSGDAAKIAANRTVGGPIDVGVIRRHSGFSYVKKKELDVQPQVSQAPEIPTEEAE